MIKIKYNNQENFEEVTFCRIGNLVRITPTKPNLSGFTTYTLDGRKLGDFSDYTTVFIVKDNSVIYSKDGSVYEEPIKLTEKQLEQQKIESEISALKQELSTFDYIGVKIAMGVAIKEEYAEQIAYTESLRQKIRELEVQLDN